MTVCSEVRAPSLNSRNWRRHPPAFTPQYKSTVARSPNQPLIRVCDTRVQSHGPKFNREDIYPNDWDLLTNFAVQGATALGPRILLHGQVQDENNRPVPNTLIECWQANAAGRYRHPVDTYLAPLDPNFGGCGRTLTDHDGRYRFRTIQPGPYPWPNGPNTWRPAHIHFSIFGHCFAQRLITQCYFEGDPFLPLCPIFQAIPDTNAANGLIAKLDISETTPHDTVAYRFDITLRGRNTTYFEGNSDGT
ncbi:MAG: protocatechuate 3,4-dioxygenase subunit beta [Aestuariivita sp.]|nr:protocatechuate 3,4-dioxygenase subunit beta [Aestuariivita sp.]MCY4201892.1 protocatechuate 3,4-dioxygenase subunit beta [Aestuariivita sp.]